MLVRMKVGRSGPTYTLSTGDEKEFPDDEAIRLITSEAAEPVSKKKIERAVATPAIETRSRRSGKKS